MKADRWPLSQIEDIYDELGGLLVSIRLFFLALGKSTLARAVNK